MKVKNIMFSGFAAAILMGVGAANAINGPVTLAEKGYVDQKVGAVAEEVATKQAADKKMSATTAKAADLADLEADEANYPSVAAAVEIANKKAKDVVTEINQAAGDLGTLKDNVEALVGKVNTTGTVADAIAGALADAKADAKTKADNALADAKADTTAQINALKLSETYEAKGEAAKALTEAKTYAEDQAADALADAKADTTAQINALNLSETYEAKGTAASQIAALDLANTYEAKGEAAKALTDAKTYTNEQVAIVDGKVTANTNAITTLTGDGEGSVAKMAADAAKVAVDGSGHAKQTALDAEIERATAAEAANAADIAALETGKLKNLESQGTYMVTRDASGNVSYTKVLVATGVAENGDAVVTE